MKEKESDSMPLTAFGHDATKPKASYTQGPVEFLLEFTNQVRLFHWLAVGTDHQALGMLYDNMSAELDKFVEQYAGMEGRDNVVTDCAIELRTGADITDTLDNCIHYLKKELTKECSEHPNLLNIIADMVGSIGLCKYLLVK